MIAAAVLTASLLLTGVPSETPPVPTLTASKKQPFMTGPQTPYRGKFWLKDQRDYTLCVLRYESNSNWFSTARAAGYFGGFKFSKPLTYGVTWMMTRELRDIYGDRTGRTIAQRLRATEMHKWRPFYQHMAFATVLNWEYAGSGQSHWAAQRNRCFL